jgi:hypothetical protein
MLPPAERRPQHRQARPEAAASAPALAKASLGLSLRRPACKIMNVNTWARYGRYNETVFKMPPGPRHQTYARSGEAYADCVNFANSGEKRPFGSTHKAEFPIVAFLGFGKDAAKTKKAKRAYGG